MTEKFTERARKVIEYARDEAVRLRHDYLGTEHLLLGVLRLGEGKAIEILANTGIDLDELRQWVEDVVQPSGGTLTMGQLPLTARAMRALEFSGEEARALNSSDINPEHLLLALLRDGEYTAAKILSGFGIDHQKVLNELTGE